MAEIPFASPVAGLTRGITQGANILFQSQQLQAQRKQQKFQNDATLVNATISFMDKMPGLLPEQRAEMINNTLIPFFNENFKSEIRPITAEMFQAKGLDKVLKDVTKITKAIATGDVDAAAGYAQIGEIMSSASAKVGDFKAALETAQKTSQKVVDIKTEREGRRTPSTEQFVDDFIAKKALRDAGFTEKDIETEFETRRKAGRPVRFRRGDLNLIKSGGFNIQFGGTPEAPPEKLGF